MNVVDSSAWLAYFSNEKNADLFAPVVEDVKNVIVPSIVLYEVFKKILKERSKVEAIEALGHMHRAKVVGVHTATALDAAHLSLEHNIGMADAMILAIAYQAGASLWTQNKDFEGIEGVNYFEV